MAWRRQVGMGLAAKALDLILRPTVAVLQGGVPAERRRTGRAPHPQDALGCAV